MAGENGLDNDYFNSITGLEGNSEGDTTSTTVENTNGQEQNDQQQQQPQQQQPVNDQTGTTVEQKKQPDPTKVQPQTQTAQPQTQAPVAGVRRLAGGEYVNNDGDIVEADGTIVAPRGLTRRYQEQATRLRGENTQITAELTRVQQQLRETTFLNGIPQQYGLTNEEVAHGLDLQTRIKKGDVVGVAKDVVAMLAAKGHNISEILGTTVGDSVDMAAIRRMLDERLAPITRQEQETVEQQQAVQRAQTSYRQFVTDNEFADVHGETIVALKQSHGLSLQQAYNATRAFAIQNGLDFSQPLGPQIAAVQQRNLQQQPQQQQNPSSRPMINGASTSDTSVKPIKPVYADPEDDWGTIIRRAQEQDAS